MSTWEIARIVAAFWFGGCIGVGVGLVWASLRFDDGASDVDATP